MPGGGMLILCMLMLCVSVDMMQSVTEVT